LSSKSSTKNKRNTLASEIPEDELEIDNEENDNDLFDNHDEFI